MKLYRCPLCGGHHEEPVCHRVHHFDRKQADEVPFEPVEVIDAAGWDNCCLCGGYARKDDLTWIGGAAEQHMKACPGCGPWPQWLKCNGCGMVGNMLDFDWVKRAPYVRKWRCHLCDSEDVEMAQEKDVPKVKQIVHETTDWVTFHLPGKDERAVMSAIMKHHIGRESVPLNEKFDFPKELQDAHWRVKAGTMKKVKFTIYSDGTYKCEVD